LWKVFTECASDAGAVGDAAVGGGADDEIARAGGAVGRGHCRATRAGAGAAVCAGVGYGAEEEAGGACVAGGEDADLGVALAAINTVTGTDTGVRCVATEWCMTKAKGAPAACTYYRRIC